MSSPEQSRDADGDLTGVTLSSIALTTGIGVIVFSTCILVLGIASKHQMIEIAPRCMARPKETIYNKDAIGAHACQNRGNPFWGWMKWCMSLSYETLLTGVPGTGTRNKGLDGKMLRINLDHIVLLRFHAICYRVAVLTTFLCIGVILPVYYTTPCPKEQTTDICNATALDFGADEGYDDGCKIFCNETASLSDYEQTTLANIPQLNEDLCGTHRDVYVGAGRCFGIRWRLVGVVLCFWIVYYYTCKIIYEEWDFLTAIRRAYYMEADHWQNRKTELEMTMLKDEDDGNPLDSDTNNSTKKWRDPWIPHPELRETTVNIDLYTVLVGSVPAPKDEEEAALLSETDWQTKAATAFFDYCVPNQPGFSSSVAAVTVLPNAPALARTWGRFTAASAAMRKLRYIRKIIEEKGTNNNKGKINGGGDDNSNNNGSTEAALLSMGKETVTSEQTLKNSDIKNNNNKDNNGGADVSGRRLRFTASKQKKERSAYRTSTRNINYYRDVIGISGYMSSEGSSFLDEENDDVLGPEQAAILSRELAQNGAGCCPNGNEWRVGRATLEELRKMEEDATLAFEEANEALREAQVAAASRGAMLVNKDGKVEVHHDRGSEKKKPSKLKLADISEVSSGDGDDDHGSTSLGANHGIVDDASSTSSVTTGRRKKGSIEEPSLYSETAEEKEEEDPEDAPFLSEIIGLPTQNANQTQPSTDQSMNTAFNGSWGFRGIATLFKSNVKAVGGVVTAAGEAGKKTTTWAGKKTKRGVSLASSKTKGIAGELVKEVQEGYLQESTYAVVTFTSRQAAAAARQCLLDGRGADEWIPVPTIPVPPLADSPVGVFNGRTCCRPVTLTIPYKTKRIRRYCVYMFLPIFYFFYTIPLTATQSWINPANWENIAPGLKENMEKNEFLNSMLTGYLPAQVFTIFIAVLPQIFKLIANFGSNARTRVEAEFSALQYYWYFMILSAFWGTSVGNFAIAAWNNFQGSDDSEFNFADVMKTLALAIPTTTSATWLNWTIIKTFMTLPLNYMVFLNSFLFRCLGMSCLARANMGGGPGGPVQYRIYVDSGVVFMALVALAPAAPLMAPFALLYFLYIQPLLRRNLIFVYRPAFDGGGLRWPFLAEMLIMALITGQIMLTVMMALKQAIAQAVMAAIPIVPTLFFHWDAQKRFLRAYQDAALVQTAVLDMWEEDASPERREEFRRFLVDAHRAAYLPTCMLGNASAALTREPAIVVPKDTDASLEVQTSSARRNLHQRGISTRRISGQVYGQVV